MQSHPFKNNAAIRPQYRRLCQDKPDSDLCFPAKGPTAPGRHSAPGSVGEQSERSISCNLPDARRLIWPTQYLLPASRSQAVPGAHATPNRHRAPIDTRHLNPALQSAHILRQQHRNRSKQLVDPVLHFRDRGLGTKLSISPHQQPQYQSSKCSQWRCIKGSRHS